MRKVSQSIKKVKFQNFPKFEFQTFSLQNFSSLRSSKFQNFSETNRCRICGVLLCKARRPFVEPIAKLKKYFQAQFGEVRKRWLRLPCAQYSIISKKLAFKRKIFKKKFETLLNFFWNFSNYKLLKLWNFLKFWK